MSVRALFLLIFVTSLTYLPFIAGHNRNVNRQQYKLIESYMDPSAAPCDDFFQYACGNWELVHQDATYLETIGFVDYQTNQELAKIFNVIRKHKIGWEHQFVRKVLDYYKSCMSVENYEPEEYIKWLQKTEQLVWPPPVPQSRKRNRNRGRSSTSHNYDWLRMLAVLRKYGLNGVMLEETVIQQREDASLSIIDLDKPVLDAGFHMMHFKGFAIILDYLDIVDEHKINQLWTQFHTFELELSDLNEIEDDLGYQLETIQHLNRTWIERYLSIIYGQTVEPTMKISIQNLPYMTALFELLDKQEPEFICRYLMVRFLGYLNVDGPNDFQKNDCVSNTRSMLPLATNWIYEQHHLEMREETENIETLFNVLIAHFQRTLDANANHFNATVLKFLHSKIATMQIKVGNLPRPNTLEKIKEFYKDLVINSSDFYGNHLNMLRFFVQAEHARLNMQIPQTGDFFHLEEHETGASSSPYYLLRSNIVIVPLTILQLPIYQRNLHDVFKYSSLGFLIAHEITHGFDDSGLEFDQRGNMRGFADVIRANEIFDSNLNCLRAKNPQGIDEKIADISGIRWAFEAYFRNRSDATAAQKPVLRGTKLSELHLFFLNFATFFCGINESDTHDSSEHGSDHQRVVDALANLAEFGQVFNCPLGTQMNPDRKCQLWR